VIFDQKEATCSPKTKAEADARRLFHIEAQAYLEAKHASDSFEAHRQGRKPAPTAPLSTSLDFPAMQGFGDEFYQHFVDTGCACRAGLLDKVRADEQGVGLPGLREAAAHAAEP
jgi:hypothetical protein